MSNGASGIQFCDGWAPPSMGVSQGSEAVFEAKFMLPWSFSEEAAVAKVHAAAAAQYVGGGGAVSRPLGDYRRRQMGRDHYPCRSALSAPHCHRGAEVLALCGER